MFLPLNTPHREFIQREESLSEALQAYPWKKAFQEEGFFSWGRYYTYGEFERFKNLLQAKRAYLVTSFVYSEGRCLDCDARMSVGDVSVLIPNKNPGGYDTITLIERYRDHNC